MSGQAAGEAGIASLLGSLVSDTGTLVRQEIKLASTEVGQKTKAAAGNVGMVLLGGALTHAGIVALIGALVLGLAPWMPPWLSAFAIGIVVVVSGVVIVNRNLKALGDFDAAPEKAIQALRQDATWIKEQVR